MTLQDIFDQLSHGELATVFAGDITGGPLEPDRKEKLIVHINMGLTALHKRFNLKQKTEVVNLVPETHTYVLTSPDLLRIEAVKDLEGNDYFLNDDNDACTLRTPNYKTLVLPMDLDTTALIVTYRADHPAISKMKSYGYAPNIAVDLPPTHLEPLLYYIASRVHNPIGMTESFHTGNNYAAKYEASCQLLEQQGFNQSELHRDDRFTRNGWV